MFCTTCYFEVVPSVLLNRSRITFQKNCPQNCFINVLNVCLPWRLLKLFPSSRLVSLKEYGRGECVQVDFQIMQQGAIAFQARAADYLLFATALGKRGT